MQQPIFFLHDTLQAQKVISILIKYNSTYSFHKDNCEKKHFGMCVWIHVLFQGKVLLDHLNQLQSRGVNLQIAVNAPQANRSDTDKLKETGRFDSFTVFRSSTQAKCLIFCFLCSGAEVREVNLQNLTGGIVHTKLWIVDKKHMYVGSANMDWRSLTQVFFKNIYQHSDRTHLIVCFIYLDDENRLLRNKESTPEINVCFILNILYCRVCQKGKLTSWFSHENDFNTFFIVKCILKGCLENIHF